MRTGCFVKICPLKAFIKVLTIAFVTAFFNANITFADSLIGQEETQNYLRWNLITGRDQLHFSKINNKVEIKTLNGLLFEKLKDEFQKISSSNKYIKSVNFKDNVVGINSVNAKVIEVELTNNQIEMFSFYRERDKKYVVDFWIEAGNEEIIASSVNKAPAVIVGSDEIKTQNAALLKPQENSQADKINEVDNSEAKASAIISAASVDATKPAKKLEQDKKLDQKIKNDKDLSKILVNPHSQNLQTNNEILQNEEYSKQGYRDYRYGATFVWDYDPIIPAFKEVINIKSKVPESFFAIENREFNKSEKEAHMQLMINFYRQKKWGLMYKSMKLFEQKYGQNTEWETKEFLKGNAILKENIEKPNPELVKNAVVIFTNLIEKSDNYELKKSIYKYLISYYYENKESLKVLQIAKAYYAGARDSFDFEEAVIPAHAILNSLARLGQVEQIKELVKEPSMKKAVPPQLLMSYQSYAYLKSGDLENVIDLYEKNVSGLAGLIDPGVLYNAAESYFRKGQFKKAQSAYQSFVKNYAYEFAASNSHLRLALCADLLDQNYEEVEALYKKAIDLSVDAQISYESRVRYVAFRSVRKIELTDRDREIRIFLEQDKNAQKPDKNLEKLLYQVRLRTLIVDKKYKEALSYLSLIPTSGMSKVEKRVFDADGAEIVYGYLQDFFQQAQYAQVIKVWKTYKDQYLDKVAQDPFINFLVGASYVKLGLYKGFDEIYANFDKISKQPVRTFPLWVARENSFKSDVLLKELSLVKDLELKNYTLVDQGINALEKMVPNYNKLNYYKGLRAYQTKNYKSSVDFFETFLANQKAKTIYDPIEVGDMIQAYTDSIYELRQSDKFLKVSEALLSDTTSFGMNNAYIQNIRERIAYLGIEISSSAEINKGLMLFEKRVNDFKKTYPKSVYGGRVNYLLAQAMLKNDKVKEARELFASLMEDKDVSGHIKELVKSELGLLNLKDKTL